jgi:hypothetical protein
MKYTSFINHVAIAKYKLNLTIADAIIVEYMQDICNSQSEKVKAKRIDGYTWLNYDHLIKELPFLNITLKTFKNSNVKRIKESGLFDFKLIKSKNGTRTYIQQTAKCDLLKYTDGLVY